MVFAGSNEDWKDPYSKIWFYPAGENKNGWIKFGWGSGFPQGGINDKGLFWDASSGPYLAMPLSEANKEKFSGPLMKKVIEECTNIDEVMKVFSEYFCEDQFRSQYLIGDSSGNSIIIEGDSILLNNKNFQVLTNFYHSHKDLGGYPCWRYEIANEMLSTYDSLTAYFIGSVLAATHQEGKYPTQYSNIYNLKEGEIYLFHFHNYEEFIRIDVNKELKNGYREFGIPELFSRMKLIVPRDGQEVNTEMLTFRWEGIEGNNYTLMYSTRQDFSDSYYKQLSIRYSESFQTINYSLVLAGFLFFVLYIKRKRLLFSILIVIISGFIITQCKKIEISEDQKVVEMSLSVSDLEPGTKYYWKIVAQPKNLDAFKSESLTRDFVTGIE